MRHTKFFLTTSVLIGLALNFAAAQSATPPVQGPEAPPVPPTFELIKTGKDAGKRDHIDFNLQPTAISVPGMKLSGFANRKLLIFYFSAVCPHCQHAIPFVQKLADDLTAQGFASIAIAIKFNSEDDVRGFIKDYKVHMPVFQDADKTFGDAYGTGSIPLLIVVNEKGEYIRYRTFNADETPKMIKSEAAQLAAK